MLLSVGIRMSVRRGLVAAHAALEDIGERGERDRHHASVHKQRLMNVSSRLGALCPLA
jgi:hypothetical protein